MCPFCEWIPRPQVEMTEREQRVDHIATFHRDRIRAMSAYNAVVEAGGSEQDARRAYNRAIARRGPGTYLRPAPTMAGA